MIGIKLINFRTKSKILVLMSWHLVIVLFQLHLSLQVVGCREFVIGHLLSEIVDYFAMGIIGQVHYPIIVDLRVPEIV